MAYFDSELPADTSTTARADAGSSVSSRIETAQDQDWFRVHLEEGRIYQFDLENTGGAEGLWDPYLRLLGTGGEITADDDSGHGLGARITYTATASGDHFLAASAFGAHTGDYRLSVQEFAAPSLIDSIDWDAPVPTTDVTVYFAEGGESFGGYASVGWDAYQIGQAMAALGEYADATALTFRRVMTPEDATFRLVAADGGFFGGTMYPQDQGANAGIGVFNTAFYDFSREGGELEPGGRGYDLLLHEFGHGLGLAHPHDTGGGSAVLRGVESFLGDYGDHDLNQAVYSVMSYNNGYLGDGIVVPPKAFGNNTSLGALDIAVLQSHYGVNSDTRTGASTYSLPDANAPGTGYGAIWDAGGIDWISHGGTAGATIDLRAATLEYEAGGGGFVSRVDGILGGFTIAHGVEIENARGGSGHDLLIGNAGANRLLGFGGDDTLSGGDGDDILLGGAGADTINGGQGASDTAVYHGASGSYAVTAAGANLYTISGGSDGGDTLEAIEFLAFSDGVFDIASLATGGLNIITGSPTHRIIGSPLGERLDGSTGDDEINGKDGNDVLRGFEGNDTLLGGDGDDRLVGMEGDDILRGEAGEDRLIGGGRGDIMDGGTGRDVARGQGGGDIFLFGDGDFSGTGGADSDRIVDFGLGADILDLSDVDAITGGADDSFVFVGTSGFSGAAGEVRYAQFTTHARVFGDTDGDRVADFAIRLDGTHVLAESDFVL